MPQSTFAIKRDTKALNKETVLLKTEINNLHQYSHRNNLIIIGVPRECGLYGSEKDKADSLVDVDH